MLEDSFKFVVEVDTETRMVTIWKTDKGPKSALVFDEIEVMALTETLIHQIQEW